MVVVRRVYPADLETWREVRLRALLDAPYAFGSTYEREAAFGEGDWLVRINSSALFMAIEGDRIVGIIGGVRPRNGAGNEREIVSMWVDASARGSGVAGQLVEAVKAWAVEDAGEALRLWVADGNERARRFYERLGFTPTGHRMPLPSDPTVEEEQMSLDLRA